MRSLITKTTGVLLFCLVFIKSWAAETEPNTKEPWFERPWAWMVLVAAFGLLIFGYIKTGEKKTK